MSSAGESTGELSPSEAGTSREYIGSKLFLGGLSWDTTEDKLREHFGVYGELVEVVVMRDRSTGRPRGFGFVTFKDPRSADQAVRNLHSIDGRQIDVKKSVPQEGKPRACKIFVGGLSPDTTEDEFKEYFGKYGQIAEVQIMQDHMSGRSRGFGFVTFEEDTSAERVFAAGQMHELGGKNVEVKPATPKGTGSQQAGRIQAPRPTPGEFGQPVLSYGGAPPTMSPGPYTPFAMYGYGARPPLMGAPYGPSLQYPGMPPQYMMMPPTYPPASPGTYQPYQPFGPHAAGPQQTPFSRVSPQYPLPASLPPVRSSSTGGTRGRGARSERSKVDSASSLDQQLAERQLKKLNLE